MEVRKFSWRARLKSFIYAFEGIKCFFKYEHNARIHSFVAIVVLIVSIILKISKLEFIAVLLSIGMVITAEMFNTALEKTMDHLSPEIHPAVKAIKDIAAAAVLIVAIIAVLIGLIIFIPRIL